MDSKLRRAVYGVGKKWLGWEKVRYSLSLGFPMAFYVPEAPFFFCPKAQAIGIANKNRCQ